MTSWQTRRLAELAAPGRSIISGPFGSSIGKRFFTDEGVPVIRGNNLTKGVAKFKDGGFVYLTPEKADELNAYAVKHDIIYTAAGTIGQVGIIPENSKYKKYTISNKQIRVRLDFSQIIPLYAYLALSSDHMISLVKRQNTGSTIPLINLEIIRNLKIQLPPVKEQERIVMVLEVWEEHIEKLERKIKLKEILTKGLVQQLFTRRLQLPSSVASWSTITFADLFKVLPKASGLKSSEYLKKGSIPIFDQSYNNYISGFTDNVEKTVKLNNPLILFGDHSRVVKFIDLEQIAVGNDGIKLLQVSKDNDAYFAYQLLCAYPIPNTGYNRHFKYLADAIFDIPEPKEQGEIARLLKVQETEIKALEEKLNHIRLQKKYLLKNLITGTIRTPENLKSYEVQS